MEKISCRGFRASGVVSGLKANQEKDLGLIVSEVPAVAAGVFTRNRVQAAPVVLDRERIQTGLAQAIIVNSGNANCCTGEQGIKDARAMAACVASELGIDENLVLVASTGVIGKPLPVDKVKSAVSDLVENLREHGFNDLAEAIMTTDTVPKGVIRKGEIGDKPFTITGVAKGAGMIRPDMATMLCFVCTDVEADPDVLKKILTVAVDRSFNRITVDGDTSTNDTVLILANGLSGAAIKEGVSVASFQKVLNDVLMQLARILVKDGEGANKFVEIIVKGAANERDADEIAGTVANSNLVKTALFGEDANWGRIIAAAGRAGVSVEPDRMDIYFDDVLMVQKGAGCGDDAELKATRVLKKPEFSISIDLNMGQCKASFFTCDFSVEYVKINADYRS